MVRVVQSRIEDQAWQRIDAMRRERDPIPSISIMIEEVIEAGLEQIAAKARRKERTTAQG